MIKFINLCATFAEDKLLKSIIPTYSKLPIIELQIILEMGFS